MNYQEVIEKQRNYFKSEKTYGFTFRKTMLKKLYAAISEYEEKILAALKTDLNKPDFEGYMTEIGGVKHEITYALKHLKNWMKPRKVKGALITYPSKSRRLPEPLGVVLIMSPWNYPVLLTLAPLVAAIAAGNCVVIKPSRFSEKTSAVLKEMIEHTFEREYISIFEGGSEVNTQLLDIKFDHIFFTGSVNVGKIVMEKAAKYLCPVTLELGGKSPCIVDETADVALAARRIMWGKSINSGQTCVAPDYLFVHKSVKSKLIDCMKKELKNFYGGSTICPEFCKIINEKHYLRLKGLLFEGDVIFGGNFSDETRQIELTLIENFEEDSQLITEEIFGPILPVITFQNIQDVKDFILKKPKPLAFYLFSNNKKRTENLTQTVSFGGGTVNDVVVHLTSSSMPFGGVGESGMGGYHGEKGFETFSHLKSVMRRGKLDIKLRYAPYKDKIKTIKKLMK